MSSSMSSSRHHPVPGLVLKSSVVEGSEHHSSIPTLLSSRWSHRRKLIRTGHDRRRRFLLGKAAFVGAADRGRGTAETGGEQSGQQGRVSRMPLMQQSGLRKAVSSEAKSLRVSEREQEKGRERGGGRRGVASQGCAASDSKKPSAEYLQRMDAFAGEIIRSDTELRRKETEGETRQMGPKKKPQPLQFGFTRFNELIVGRAAMLGFGASLIGEALTGKGILAQLNMETGIPIYEAEPMLLFFILFSLVAAVRGLDSKGGVAFRSDVGSRKQKAQSRSLRGMLGLPETGPLFAFATPNELFVGRMAQLGFAFALIGEIVTGKGALAQIRIETGMQVTDIEPLIILSIAFFFLSTIDPETGCFWKCEEEDD